MELSKKLATGIIVAQYSVRIQPTTMDLRYPNRMETHGNNNPAVQ